MKIKNVFRPEVITINVNSSFEEAVAILYKNKISGVPVVDDDGKIVGILSEKDLFKVLYPYETSFALNPEMYLDFESRENKVDDIKNKKISEFMSKNVIVVDVEMPLLKAGGLMLARGIHRLPVLENGKLVGIVSRSDIFGRIFKNHLNFE
jgi:CBS domain-containing protein